MRNRSQKPVDSEPIGAVVAAMMPFFVIFLLAGLWRLG